MKKKKTHIDHEVKESYYGKQKSQAKTPKIISPIVSTRRLNLKEVSKTETKILLDVFESLPFEPFVLMTYDEDSKTYNYKKKGLTRFVIINTFFAFIIVLIVMIYNNTDSIDVTEKLKFIGGCSLISSVFLFGLGRLHFLLLTKQIKKQVDDDIL